MMVIRNAPVLSTLAAAATFPVPDGCRSIAVTYMPAGTPVRVPVRVPPHGGGGGRVGKPVVRVGTDVVRVANVDGGGVVAGVAVVTGGVVVTGVVVVAGVVGVIGVG
jgi:hypothetical protein